MYDFGEIEGVVFNFGYLMFFVSFVLLYLKMVILFFVLEEMSFDYMMIDVILNFWEYLDILFYYNRFKGFDFLDGCFNICVEMCYYL